MLTLVLAVLSLIWVIVAWCVLVMIFRRAWGPYLRDKRLPKTSVQSAVRSKQGREEPNPYTGEQEMVQKLVTFGCEDGMDRTYEVHDDVWDWVEVGDDGVLTYQGDRFISFDARRPRVDLDKAYRKLTRN